MYSSHNGLVIDMEILKALSLTSPCTVLAWAQSSPHPGRSARPHSPAHLPCRPVYSLSFSFFLKFLIHQSRSCALQIGPFMFRVISISFPDGMVTTACCWPAPWARLELLLGCAATAPAHAPGEREPLLPHFSVPPQVAAQPALSCSIVVHSVSMCQVPCSAQRWPKV